MIFLLRNCFCFCGTFVHYIHMISQNINSIKQDIIICVRSQNKFITMFICLMINIFILKSLKQIIFDVIRIEYVKKVGLKYLIPF